jgi:hypothetical protein
MANDWFVCESESHHWKVYTCETNCIDWQTKKNEKTRLSRKGVGGKKGNWDFCLPPHEHFIFYLYQTSVKMFVNSLEFRQTPLKPIGNIQWGYLLLLSWVMTRSFCFPWLKIIADIRVFFLLTVTCEMMHLEIDHREEKKTLGQVSEHLFQWQLVVFFFSIDWKDFSHLLFQSCSTMHSTDTMCQTATVACFCILSSSSSSIFLTDHFQVLLTRVHNVRRYWLHQMQCMPSNGGSTNLTDGWY